MKNCPKCQTVTQYDAWYDATFCPTCNEWLETACPPEDNCQLCKERPARPIEV